MLPQPGSPWPPPAIEPALRQWAEWDAWWIGDPALLAATYGGSYTARGPQVRPGQLAGGIVGALSRMWWGRAPASAGIEPEVKLHVPLASDLCRVGSDMLFSEPLAASSPDKDASARLGVLLDDTGQAKLLEAAETVAAHGGGYLRVVYDKTVSNRAWFDTVAPESAVPSWRWGNLFGVTFWREVYRQDGQVWRHLEWHEPGWIVHALYQGEDGKIGRPVPLQDMPATEGLAALVNAEGAVATGYPGLDVTYIPHALPNPRWRRNELLAPMGRSVLDGTEGMLDALDMTFSSLMADVDLGRGRVIVPGSWLDDQGPGRGATFDPNRKYFAAVPGALRMERPEVVQFAIRVEQLAATCDLLLAQILRRAGYSQQTIGERGDVAVTATETNARERRSFVTRGRQIGYWRPALAERALPALLGIDAFAFGRRHDPAAEVHVEFADSVSPSESELANVANLWNQAAAASIETKVRYLHPDWSKEQVAAEVALIRDDAAAAMPAPFDYGLGEGEPTETDDQRTAAGDGAEGGGEPVDPVEGDPAA